MDDQLPEEMVLRVEWFVHIDYEIMIFFNEHDHATGSQTPLVVTPKTLAKSLDYGRSYVGDHLRLLRDAGLLEQTGRGMYKLSDFGKDYLDGNVDLKELQDRDPTADEEE